MNGPIENKYDKILLHAIDNLDDFDKKIGGNGEAYFLNSKFVLRKEDSSRELEKYFELFCEEQIKLKKCGYNVPEIYSYHKQLNGKFKEGRPLYDYYILYERVPGRSLYLGFLEESYELFKDLCSGSVFGKVIKNPYTDILLFEEIVRSYIRDYIKINEYLLSMSDEKLGDFVSNAYNIAKNSSYGGLDLDASNVLISDNQMRLIDIEICDFEDIKRAYSSGKGEYDEEAAIQNFLISNLIGLFAFNNFINRPNSGILFNLSNKLDVNVLGLVKKNLQLSGVVLEKLIRVINKVLDRPKISDGKTYKKIYNNIEYITNPKLARQLISQIEKNF